MSDNNLRSNSWYIMIAGVTCFWAVAGWAVFMLSVALNA